MNAGIDPHRRSFSPDARDHLRVIRFSILSTSGGFVPPPLPSRYRVSIEDVGISVHCVARNDAFEKGEGMAVSRLTYYGGGGEGGVEDGCSFFLYG